RAKEVAKGASPQLSNERLLRGFGSYGGEEHVSYMLVAEAKATAPGEEFTAWSKQMRARLAQIQREDGTWRGDHCITSTTFCTAASLIDRKSTRLNSSHVANSYAVFCLNKKI